MEYRLSIAQTVLLGMAIAWDLAWKGVALWRASRNSHSRWFVALLVLNSAGVLPMVYLWLCRRRNERGLFRFKPAHSH